MKTNKEVIKRKGLGMIVVATIASLALLGLYLVAGTNKLSPILSDTVIYACIAAVVLGLVIILGALLFKKVFPLLGIAMYSAALFAFIEYIVSQLNYITNVFYGVDGNSFTVAMFASAAVGIVAFATALIGSVFAAKANRKQNK